VFVNDTEFRLAKLIDKLRKRGCRLTPQRRAVIKILIGSQDHPTVEQIYEQVRQDFPMTSLATVYKTVALLKEMGEVREIGFGEGGNRYDGYDPSPHPHLICVECSRIVDLDLPALDELPQSVAELSQSVAELSQSVAREMGYRIIGHRFDFFGVCPQCQAA
jgi:Fur family peroxide stress response transcriptional regulator